MEKDDGLKDGVKRYQINCYEYFGDRGAEIEDANEENDGIWVSYEDHAAALKAKYEKITELREIIAVKDKALNKSLYRYKTLLRGSEYVDEEKLVEEALDRKEKE